MKEGSRVDKDMKLRSKIETDNKTFTSDIPGCKSFYHQAINRIIRTQTIIHQSVPRSNLRDCLVKTLSVGLQRSVKKRH